MISILTNVITTIRYDNHLSQLWACHGHPYLSVTMFYTSIFISTVIANEMFFLSN